MKKTFKFILAAFAIVTAASCAQEIEDPDVLPQEEVELVPMTITVGGEATKTTVGEDNAINWCADDEIAVFDNTGTARKFTIVEGTLDGNKATFEGEVAAGSTDFTAVYPFSSAVSVSEGVVTVNTPDVQVLDGATIADGATVSVAQFTKDNSEFTFKTAIGYLRVDVKEADVTSIIVKGTNIAGQASFNAAGELQSVAEGKNQVTLTPAAGEVFTNGTSYYVTVLPGKYAAEDFSITLVRETELAAELAATKEVTILRNQGFFLDSGKLSYKFVIKDAETLQKFLDNAADYTAKDKAEIVNDIDLTDVTLTSATSFKGVLDGGEHSLKNWKSEATSLFTTFSGTVKNLVLDSSCYLVPPTSGGKFGFITKDMGAYSVMENCINNADIVLNTTTIEQIYFGSLVGVSYGTMKQCVNNGHISISVSENVSANCAIGGLAGYLNVSTQFTKMGESHAYALIDCKNTGDITYVVNGTAKNLILGGVAGGTSYGAITEAVFKGKAKGCVNTGHVSYTLKNGGELIDGNAGYGNYNNVGGVLGYWEGSIENCVNGVVNDNSKAKVTLVSPTSSNVATSTRQAVGGVVAFVLQNVISCTNYGQVDLVCASQTGGETASARGITGYPSAGGVVAQAGTLEEGAQSKYQVSDCHNYGELDFQMWMGKEIKTTYYMGGVIGYSNIPVSDCSNNGAMKTYTMAQNGYSGGVAGYLDTVSATRLANTGRLDFTFARTVDGSLQIAGNVAAGGITANSTVSLTESTNSGAMTVTINSSDLNHAQAKIGGVVGNQPDGELDKVYNEGAVTVKQNAKPSVVLGGVASWLKGNIKVNEAKNTGAITFNAANMTGQLWCGGVFGYKEIDPVISGCVNEGSINIDATLNKQSFIGGVLGNTAISRKIDGKSTNFPSTFTNCENKGTITVNIPSTTDGSFYYLAGICATNGGHDYENCSNTGNITYDGAAKLRLGGIAPYTNRVATGTVKCDITVISTGIDFSEVGGVVAYSSGTAVTNARFEGTINTSGSTKKVYTGGLVGKTASGQKYNGCKFGGSLVSAAGNNVPGLYSGGLQNNNLAFTFGDTNKCVVAAGSSINGSVVTKLTKENLVSQVSNDGSFISTASLNNIEIE